MDDDGSWVDCAPGEVGLLMINGPVVFAGYVTDPKLDGPRVSRDDLVHDGWLNTGDLGRLDADGFVYLDWTGQGPHHPRRPQHRPVGDRGSTARATPPSSPPPPSDAPTSTPARSPSRTSCPPTPTGSTRRS